MAKKTIVIFLFIIPILFIFKNWFIFPFLSAHDWPYFFKETLSDYLFFPPAWSPTFDMGLGGEMINYGLGTFIYAIVSLFVNTIGLPWELVYKIFIFGLFLFLSVFSSVYLLGRVLKNPTKLQLLLSALIFTANTYILMVLDGGQIGVALAYSITPLVLSRFIKIIQNSKFIIHNSVLAGVVLTIQIMFDLRIAFVTMGIALFYTIYYYLFIERFDLKLYTICYLLVSLIVLGLNAYWFLPIIVFRSHPVQEFLNNFNSIQSFQFFSFTTFSNSISLLHPNWPENIFGKVYFMRSEFIILPILAYLGLLFVKSSKFKASSYAKALEDKQNSNNNIAMKQLNNQTFLFFAFLGLLGAFLVKGANPPLSEINNWFFIYLPFSALFRDSTKFYLLIALAYSMLIPFSIGRVNEWLQTQKKFSIFNFQFSNKFKILNVILLFAICYLLFLIRPVFLDQLNGTFKKQEIPEKYILLKDFLYTEKDFSRTLWIPRQDRYNFYSYLHPAMSGEDLFSATNSADIIRKLRNEQSPEFLSNLSIKYIIIPYDSFGEIFVKDREYNEKEYSTTVKLLDSVNWLKKIKGFGKINVYEVPSHKDHFWLNGQGRLSYSAIGPSEYKLEVSIDEASNIIFTDYYSPYWLADTGSEKLTSTKTDYSLNSFPLKKGTYTLTVSFSKQAYYTFGRIITLFFIAILLFAIIFLRKRDNL